VFDKKGLFYLRNVKYNLFLNKEPAAAW